PDPRSLERSTAAQWLRRWMGESTYRVVWEPLLRGKFQSYAEEIAMPWFWGRVHCRTSRLGYLRGGFQQLYERMADEIRRMGGTVRLGESAEQIESSPTGQVVVRTSAGTSEYERLLVTLPTRLFVQLAGGLPLDYVRRYRAAGDHLSAHCTVLALDRPLTSIYWLNIGDPGYPFLSLVEHTNLMPPEDYGGRRLVYLGNYLPPDHPLFSMPGEQILAGLWPALKRINPRFDPSWVTESWHFQAPFAQPIVRRGYPDQLAPHQTPLPNVFLANMGHVYPQDRGQNYSMLLGEDISRLLLGQPDRRASSMRHAC
ncbi:MAG: FAD-dependent oxidoreductase, partial [Chloroflexi bacterium]|nr:FAD-dependent oxidoreductase [Chloroflexota bacterium]